MRPLLALAGILLVAACGGGDPEQPAGEFVDGLFTRIFAGHYASVWDDLYPPHQEGAPRARYVSCGREEPDIDESAVVRVLSVREEMWQVAGEEDSRESTAVTFRITVAGTGATSTGHLIAVDGSWRWILSPTDYEAFAAGECP
ncbi:MAG: hypothetical protein M3168_02025 [Actinomycetota bacterium]|nr:hypothetical protein [Actinomycetota bacterium]